MTANTKASNTSEPKAPPSVPTRTPFLKQGLWLSSKTSVNGSARNDLKITTGREEDQES